LRVVRQGGEPQEGRQSPKETSRSRCLQHPVEQRRNTPSGAIDASSRGDGTGSRALDAGGETPEEAEAQESIGPRVGQSLTHGHGLPKGAKPWRRTSPLISASLLEPLRTIQSGWRSSTQPGTVAASVASVVDSDGNVRATGADTAPIRKDRRPCAAGSWNGDDPHRPTARWAVPMHVGNHDAPRRIAFGHPPGRPGRSFGKPSRVHPGTWQHVRPVRTGHRFGRAFGPCPTDG